MFLVDWIGSFWQVSFSFLTFPYLIDWNKYVGTENDRSHEGIKIRLDILASFPFSFLIIFPYL